MIQLSVIIITKNEATNIRACLESVKWVDEIIVLDSGSTDGTQAICQEYAAQVFDTDWPGFGVQKNRALAKAQGRWVLSLDADEQLSPELTTEIQTIINTTPATHAAYDMPRLSSYCGHVIRFGDWRSDYQTRLFQRGKAQFKEVPVHECLLVEGSTGRLKATLHHESFKNLEQVLAKVNHYSTLSAQWRAQNGKKGGLRAAILHGLWTFIRGYIIRFGFLDGKAGFMLAVSNAEGCYYRYLKLMLLAQATDSASDC